MLYRQNFLNRISLSGLTIVSILACLCLLGHSFIFSPACRAQAQDTRQLNYRITDFEPMSTTFGRVKGLITNKTDKDFREVIFNLMVYDAQGVILGRVKFSVRNLTSGKTKEFMATIKAKHKLIDHYSIYFVSGTTFKKVLESDTNPQP